MRERRGPWYLLTGLLLGLGMGLFYAWVISPVEYVDTSPSALRQDFKERYRALVAMAFIANGDIARAGARLQKLRDADSAQVLAEQAQRSMAEGKNLQEAQALGLLAVSLGGSPTPLPASSTLTSTTIPSTPTMAVTIPSSFISPPPPTIKTATVPSASQTPLPIGTPLPTQTPTSLVDVPYRFKEQTFICDEGLGIPFIQVVIYSMTGEQVPGVEIVVSWDGGEDHFFTGLKPELGLGFADFAMTPGTQYSLHLAGSKEFTDQLVAAECKTESGERFWGSWLLVFQQP